AVEYDLASSESGEEAIGPVARQMGRKVIGGKDSDHAFMLPRLTDVEPADPTVRDGAPEELHMGHARQHEIPCLHGVAGDLLRRGAPNNTLTYGGVGRHRCRLPLHLDASDAPASTLWPPIRWPQ